MASKRSSLLLRHRQATRQRPRNPPAHHGKTKGGIIQQNGPLNPPDLLDDSKYEARHTPQSHGAPRFVHSERRGIMDQDLIQIDDDLPYQLYLDHPSLSIIHQMRRIEVVISHSWMHYRVLYRVKASQVERIIRLMEVEWKCRINA
jgi:hypothetical protein